jgi:C4-dicarboxylate-binding protein DctP
MVTNQRLWQSLAAMDRELINHALQDALVFANQIAVTQNDLALQALRQAGTTRIHTPNPDQLKLLRAAVQPVQVQLAQRIGSRWMSDLKLAIGSNS